jgi:hypothetical protein
MRCVNGSKIVKLAAGATTTSNGGAELFTPPLALTH